MDTNGEEVVDRQVQVKFITKLPPALRVVTSAFAIPAKLGRYGLSEVVNTLLGLGIPQSHSSPKILFSFSSPLALIDSVRSIALSEKPQPFDFLVDGELLRTSVEQFLLTKGITAVSLATILYVYRLG